MKFEELLGRAEWVGTGDDADMPIITDTFSAHKGDAGEITIIGLGVFSLYINGKRAHDTLCLPLACDYEASDFPSGELLGHRIYAEVIDISALLIDGENRISVILGNGWYNKPIWEEEHGDGRKKAAWRITIGKGTDRAVEYFSSAASSRWLPSRVTYNHYNKGEEQDLRLPTPEQTADISALSHMLRPTIVEDPLRDTDYCLSDCPRDRVIRSFTPNIVSESNGVIIYDIGINTTGYPKVRMCGNNGDEVKITFSEALNDSGDDISMYNSHEQRFNLIDNGMHETVLPYHGWICARYARLEGKAELIGFDEVHTDVAVSATFESDNEVLNYIYDVFLHTQLINMHTGIPSDCPQIERRGYTGDGQLIAHSAMLMTDSKSFYRKWLYDIADCQDRISGHVQYTAPYTHAGGGTGGWGCAIAAVPYEYYLRFGDSEPMAQMFDGMLAYLDYFDAHCVGGLLTHDRDGEWCLGDWCPPGNNVIIPPPLVNSYFYIRTCKTMIEMAQLIGRTDEIAALRARMEEKRKITKAAYFNNNDGIAVGGVQGADAFCLNMGIGDERTKAHLISYYDELGHYDTGIFGTEIVTRLLFEYGRADIAVRLMTAAEPHGFGLFKKLGYTTLPEYWLGNARSHAHPMFGAIAAYLFDYILGIRMQSGSVGYTDIVIEPLATDIVRHAGGSILNMYSQRIAIEYERVGETVTVKADIPHETSATLRLGGRSYPLGEGKSELRISLCD